MPVSELVHRNEEPLFDHPVRLREKHGWKIEANRFRGFQADDQLKSARPLDRQVARIRTPQNFVDRSDRSLHKLSIYGSVTQKGMGRHEACPIKIDDRGQAFVHGKLRHDRHHLRGTIRRQHQAPWFPFVDLGERGLYLIWVRDIDELKLQIKRARGVIDDRVERLNLLFCKCRDDVSPQEAERLSGPIAAMHASLPFRVKSGKAQCEHMFSALPPTTDNNGHRATTRHVRFVPQAAVRHSTSRSEARTAGHVER